MKCRWGDQLGLWKDLGVQALLSLSDHRLRAFLSVLGIAIGIAAVILIGVVSQGGKQMVFSELETFGLKSTWLFRDRRITDPRRAMREGSGINNEDMAAIAQSQCCPGLRHISPVVSGGKNIPPFVRANGLYAQARVEGVGNEYLAVNNDDLVLGRPFSIQDVERGRHYAIIGEQIRKELFPNVADPLGQELRIGDMRLTVTGVLRNKERSFLSSIGSGDGNGVNTRVLVPYKRLQALTGHNEINVIQAELASGANQSAIDQLAAFLRHRHKGAFEYRTESMEQYVKTAQNILNGVSTIGVVAASVSLFVAGLGILNIMSTSVLERTREIGLRKAVGGSSRDILLQFLFEASLISLLGGSIGLVLGGLGSLLIASLAHFPLLPSVPLIAASLLVALLVGIVSGIYPAYRAAQLRPVEALRYE